jgi:hypothetical protein
MTNFMEKKIKLSEIKCINYFLLILGFTFSCSISKNRGQLGYKVHDFTYFQTVDTIILKLVKFYENNAYCYTEGIPYALLIGTPLSDSTLPDTISVLAICDNKKYVIGDTLNILQINNPETTSSLHKITIIKDTLIQRDRYRWAIGSEYQGTWGKVMN